MFVSPAEPPALRQLGVVSSIPESLGCDFAWTTATGWIGVQRKTVDDLVGSIQDGRLSKEVAQMQQVRVAELIVEGRPDWTSDSRMVRYPSMTRAGFNGLLRSVQAGGVIVVHTDAMQATMVELEDFSRWAAKDVHNALIRRPNPAGAWGQPNSREWLLHLMQGFNMIGPGKAAAIVDWFLENRGMLPIGWLVSEDELTEVPGIGEKTARGLVEALSVNGKGKS